MLAVRDIETLAGVDHEPDLSETYGRTVEAPARTVERAAASLDLVGTLVRRLVAAGVGEHIVTPCADGLVWSFDRSRPGQVRLAWAVTVMPETDDATHVAITLHATASDHETRERLFEAWPVIGPVVELHAQRVLHGIEALAEDAVEDPFEG
jgi:hypothetical protein